MIAARDPGAVLDRLTEFMVDEIMSMTDEEIRAEAEEDGIDIEAEAAEMRALIAHLLTPTQPNEE